MTNCLATYAQTPVPAATLPAQLSLAQALVLAQANRGTVQNLALDERVAAQTARATRGGYLPQVSGSAEARYNAVLPTNIVPDFANPASGERLALRFGSNWQADVGVSVNQKLYDGAALAQRRVDVVSEQLAANATLRGRVQLVEDVSRAYYDALLSEASLNFARADEARTAAAARDLEARQLAGRALANDVAAARINAATARLSRELAERNQALNKQNLVLTLGFDPAASGAGPPELRDPLQDLTTARADTAAWGRADSARLVVRRPDYQQEQLSGELAVATLRAEQRGYLPRLSVLGYLGAQGYNDNFRAAYAPGNWFGNSYVALQLAVPVFDGNARATRLATQRLRAEQARNRQRELSRRAGYEVRRAASDLLSAWQALRVRQANVAVAALSGELVRLRQQAGRALPREVLDAEVTRQQAQRDYVQGLHDFLAARLDYARVTGTLLN